MVKMMRREKIWSMVDDEDDKKKKRTIRDGIKGIEKWWSTIASKEQKMKMSWGEGINE